MSKSRPNKNPSCSSSSSSESRGTTTNHKKSKWSKLTTIKDFDFGIGDMDKSPIVRISELAPNVYQSSEVNLIVWLLLEKESNNWEFPDTEAQSDSLSHGDSVDSISETRTPTRFPVQWGAGLSKGALTRRRACSYAENLLRAVGVNVPFELLEATKRTELFQMFSSSSNLLRGERYSSILDLYEALRRRSKFREEFEVIGTLGSGAFGQVYSVKDVKEKDSDGSSLSAIKRVPISSLESLDSILLILNESSVLNQLQNHPHIVQFFDSWLEYDSSQDNLVFYLQMELCGVSLADWKEASKKLLEPGILWKITNQLISALEWIHGKGFMHLDINPKNILWSNSSNTRSSVKLTDFGLAFQGTSVHGRVGTVPYCAPENTLTPKSDIYSLGVSLFEISQIFSTRSELVLRLDKREVEPSALSTGVWFLDQIIPSMLKKQPSHRISLEDLKLNLGAMCNESLNQS